MGTGLHTNKHTHWATVWRSPQITVVTQVESRRHRQLGIFKLLQCSLLSTWTFWKALWKDFLLRDTLSEKLSESADLCWENLSTLHHRYSLHLELHQNLDRRQTITDYKRCHISFKSSSVVCEKVVKCSKCPMLINLDWHPKLIQYVFVFFSLYR